MASQQAYISSSQNKGTLVSGQSIAVNKFTVQVERYLSQGKSYGGFAHVYLVRTVTPVYNTTHHVLKRIAVANEAMLTEVKKEVDVMRLLKGHPNIVHLIDAAWHKMPNGMYEVFILMEFCPGGGIIDMMNRRLRERLTEAEILQIFVDVCEGVAYMHNLRPALLHRDLKVENILQSTPTSFKLCDFGSATTVARPPSTTQEIRALEADLNRHTTLQYRAPEMVDLYSRKPVDEKSDVWALGVLLYKLCYYTTPFEEHGQLAILNVQYRIPPYPVYSTQMNQLIGSMLQEHGMRRPSVFELLSHVHVLRGTKSRFKYTIPVPQPLSPRHQTQFKPSASPNHIEHVPPPPNAILMSVSPNKSKGVQAREQVMEAIAPMRRGRPYNSSESEPTSGSSSQKYPDPQIVPPMRRGRPTISKESESTSRPSSAQRLPETQRADADSTMNWLEDSFAPEDDNVWKSAPNDLYRNNGGSADAWNVAGKEVKRDDKKDTLQGFGDDFGEKLWDSFGNSSPKSNQNINISTKSYIASKRVGPNDVNGRLRDGDAFEGLGLEVSLDKPAPTLGEARKLRTGLAVMNVNGFRYNTDRASGPSTSPRPPYSPQPQLQPPSQLYPQSTSPVHVSSTTNSSFRSSPQPPVGRNPPAQPQPQAQPYSQLASHNLSTTTSTFRSSPQPPIGRNPSAQPDGLPAESRFPSLEELDANFSSPRGVTSNKIGMSRQGPEKPIPIAHRPVAISRPSVGNIALLKPDSHPRGAHSQEGIRSEQVTGIAMRESRGGSSGRGASGSADIQKHDAAKSTSTLHASGERRPSLTRKHRSSVTMKHTSHPSTGEETSSSHTLSPGVAKTIKPSSRDGKPRDWLTGDDDYQSSSSALISTSPVETPILRDSPSKRASVIQRSSVPVQDAAVAQHARVERTPSSTPSDPAISPTISKFTRAFPPIDNGQQSATNTENWNAITTRASGKLRDIESSSSADEGPEDAGGFTRVARISDTPKRKTRKGRQSSVHDLVDLYGGRFTPKDKERDAPANGDEDATPQRPKERSIASPSTLAATNTMLSPLHLETKSSSRRPTASDAQRNQPTSGGRPSPSRSRPQSMFIFPSKSADSFSPSSVNYPVSPGLVPPRDPKQRTNIRRTSISDMVQKFEGISGSTKAVGSGPPLVRPISKLGSNATDTGSYPRGQPNGELDPTGSLLTIPGNLSSAYAPRSPTRTSPGLSRTSPISSPTPVQHDTLYRDSEDIIPRNTSLRSEAPKSVFPSRKATNDSSSRPDSGSSSPERPYQGVGKLIDQWQRKTTEADPPRATPKRGAFAAKRAGIIHGSG